MKKNCWEVKKCGREPGGESVHELGVCPAAVDKSVDGINNGAYGGRLCWAIAGTFCGGKRQGTFAEKRLSCMGCDFYKSVLEEEGEDFELLKSDSRENEEEKKAG
jgi:hypothetical protein